MYCAVMLTDSLPHCWLAGIVVWLTAGQWPPPHLSSIHYLGGLEAGRDGGREAGLGRREGFERMEGRRGLSFSCLCHPHAMLLPAWLDFGTGG